MKPQLVIIGVLLSLMSCSNGQTKESNQAFKNDQIAFVNSLELFKKAQLSLYKLVDSNKTVSEEARTNKDSLLAFIERYKKQNLAILKIYNEAINEGDKVSDKYLDFLHSDFKTMYREKFLASMKLGYEIGLNGINNNYSEESISKATVANKKRVCRILCKR